MKYGLMSEWFRPGSSSADRFVARDEMPASYKVERLRDGGEVIREGWDQGYSLTHRDVEGGEVVITQTGEVNSVAMGRFATAFYDREGRLVSLDISLVCVGVMAAKMGIRPAVDRAERISDYFTEGQDTRLIVDIESGGITFVEANLKGMTRILGGGRLTEDSLEDCIWVGNSPLFGLPISVFRFAESLYVCVNGEQGYAWSQICRYIVDPRIFKYGLSAAEIDGLVFVAFPPEGYVASND